MGQVDSVTGIILSPRIYSVIGDMFEKCGQKGAKFRKDGSRLPRIVWGAGLWRREGGERQKLGAK
ncbi:MAG: hypothetical protein E4G98_03620 [Promethearchaeota archaeon]|nr:MAG: hypothetical protein E4G98_03620 [Candidatus Lokiarchaeota archaeon]